MVAERGVAEKLDGALEKYYNIFRGCPFGRADAEAGSILVRKGERSFPRTLTTLGSEQVKPSRRDGRCR